MILFIDSSKCSRGSAAYSLSYGGLLFAFRRKSVAFGVNSGT